MKVLHLASFNRWTGAAAPAFEEVEALRAAGVEAHYAFVGGGNLEERLAGRDFVHPILLRRQDPFSFLLSVRAIRKLVRQRGFDVVHAHLSHDHWMARFALRTLPSVGLVRTFHAERPLRSDPITRSFIDGCDAICVVNEHIRNHPVLRGRPVTVTPPPVDRSRFHPDGPDARDQWGLGPDVPVVGFMGKMVRERGFDLAVTAFAHIRRELPEARMVIIGRGPYRDALEDLATQLGVAEAILWAGYRDDDLPDHLRMADVMLFTVKGSDEGHRAVIESLACGTPPAAYPVEGLDTLLGELPELIAPAAGPEALARVALDLLAADDSAIAAHCSSIASRFAHEAAAERLITVYESIGVDRAGAPLR